MEPVGEIDRRSLMLAGAATAGGLVLESLTPAAAAPVPRRPNIVWFRSEDNGVDFVGCYGNPLARTPTIDKLAREGVRFDLHFATSPVCAPTKLATLTGMHAESLGPGHHMRADARTPPFVRGFATYLRRAGYWCSEQGLPGANPDRNTTSTRTGYHDASGDWRNRPAGKPFFVLRGSQTTHETQAAFPYPGRTNPAKVRLPVYHPDDPVLRLGRAHYFDRVAAMDGELAGLLRRLEDDNLLANTIVIYSADHGGVLPRSKRYCYDSGLRAPLVMWFPPRWRHLAPVAPGSVYRAPTSSVDAPAAILSLAGVRRPAHFQGKPFAGTTVSRRAYAFSGRGRMDEQLDMVRTVRGRRYRYIRNYRPHLTYAQHHQFMWLQHPDEVVNLAGRPEHRATLRRMRRVLRRHVLATHDNGFIPEGMAAEGYAASRRRGAFPIRRVVEVADLASEGRARHQSPIVRYWGAMGCSVLGERAAGAVPLLRRAATSDPSPWVRAQAADALARAGRTDAAVPVLEKLCRPGNPGPVRLEAIWSLARAGTAALPALPTLLVTATDLDNVGRYAVRVVSGTYVPLP